MSDKVADAAQVPLVSVVMAVHNDAERVERAVRSILDQSLRAIELIVVDDGSDDGSGEVLERLSASDDRVRLLRQPNLGLTRSLIRGCEEARAEFVARHDSDDWSHPRRLEEQHELLASDQRLGFVSCGTRYVGPQGERLQEMTRSTDAQAATAGLLERRQGPPAHGSVMFRLSSYQAAGGYRPEFRFAQDADLWLRMAEHSLYRCLGEIRYFHRKEVDSTSGVHRPAQKRFGELAHLCRSARLEGRDEGPILAEAARLSTEVASAGSTQDPAAAAAAAYFLGTLLMSNGDGRARGYFLQALRLRPWSLRAWVRLAQCTVQGGAKEEIDG